MCARFNDHQKWYIIPRNVLGTLWSYGMFFDHLLHTGNEALNDQLNLLRCHIVWLRRDDG